MQDIKTMFGSPIKAQCSIQRWFLSAVGSTSPLAVTDQTAIRMNQAGRTDPMAPLAVNIATTTANEQQFDFKINLFLVSSDPLTGILYNKQASV